MTPSGNPDFLTCSKRCKAKPNRQKTNTFKIQQQQKGSQIRQNRSTQSLFRLEQHMTQFCRQETQSSVRGVGCQSESTRPRNQETSLPGVPWGMKVPGESIHGFQFPLFRFAHLPKSNSTLNITQPRKMPLCAFFS